MVEIKEPGEPVGKITRRDFLKLARLWVLVFFAWWTGWGCYSSPGGEPPEVEPDEGGSSGGEPDEGGLEQNKSSEEEGQEEGEIPFDNISGLKIIGTKSGSYPNGKGGGLPWNENEKLLEAFGSVAAWIWSLVNDSNNLDLWESEGNVKGPISVRFYKTKDDGLVVQVTVTHKANLTTKKKKAICVYRMHIIDGALKLTSYVSGTNIPGDGSTFKVDVRDGTCYYFFDGCWHKADKNGAWRQMVLPGSNEMQEQLTRMITPYFGVIGQEDRQAFLDELSNFLARGDYDGVISYLHTSYPTVQDVQWPDFGSWGLPPLDSFEAAVEMFRDGALSGPRIDSNKIPSGLGELMSREVVLPTAVPLVVLTQIGQENPEYELKAVLPEMDASVVDGDVVNERVSIPVFGENNMVEFILASGSDQRELLGKLGLSFDDDFILYEDSEGTQKWRLDPNKIRVYYDPRNQKCFFGWVKQGRDIQAMGLRSWIKGPFVVNSDSKDPFGNRTFLTQGDHPYAVSDITKIHRELIKRGFRVVTPINFLPAAEALAWLISNRYAEQVAAVASFAGKNLSSDFPLKVEENESPSLVVTTAPTNLERISLDDSNFFSRLGEEVGLLLSSVPEVEGTAGKSVTVSENVVFNGWRIIKFEDDLMVVVGVDGNDLLALPFSNVMFAEADSQLGIRIRQGLEIAAILASAYGISTIPVAGDLAKTIIRVTLARIAGLI